ncbi:Transposon Tf2-6 poly, partial [Paramuricea clavata]
MVIPQKLQPRVIELGHKGHQGILKMKQRLRTKVWWPGIDQEAEKFCKTCHGCQVVSRPINPEPLQMTELPQGPWQDIAIDFMGPLPSGDYVFAATDYYSRYVEVTIAKRNTAEVAIKSLENMFATHGLPWTVTSDNGPHFITETFESFLQENGIEHRKTTPLWPQANGEIEKQQNRSLLNRMEIARVEEQDWRKAMQTYLIAYRNTPHPTTGMCPAELMFRRKLRTKLPELRENVRLDEEMKEKVVQRKSKCQRHLDTGKMHLCLSYTKTPVSSLRKVIAR